MSAPDLRVPAPLLAQLLRQRPGYVLAKLLLLVVLWLGLALAARCCPSLLGRVALWLAAGFFVNGLVQLAHDSWHGNLLPWRPANDLLGHLLSMLCGVSFPAARHDHLLHHRHSRTARDPDAYNVGRRSLGLVVLFYAVVLFGLPLSIVFFNVIYPVLHFDRRDFAAHLRTLLAYGAVYALLFTWVTRAGQWGTVLELWFLPVLFASPFNGLKSIADHHHNQWNGPRHLIATTTRSNALIAFFWNGLSYHLDHHLYPRVPGYHLPALHRALRPALTAAGAPVFDSYLAVWAAALRRGPVVVGEDVATLRRSPAR